MFNILLNTNILLNVQNTNSKSKKTQNSYLGLPFLWKSLSDCCVLDKKFTEHFSGRRLRSLSLCFLLRTKTFLIDVVSCLAMRVNMSIIIHIYVYFTSAYIYRDGLFIIIYHTLTLSVRIFYVGITILKYKYTYYWILRYTFTYL